MNRTGIMALVLAASVFAQAQAAMFGFVSGPEPDSTKLVTPWGDFVAVDQHDGEVWVGTPEEYEHARIQGVIHDLGFRKSCIARNEYTSKDSAQAHSGATCFDTITVKPDKTQTFQHSNDVDEDLIWRQNDAQQFDTLLYFPSVRKFAKPWTQQDKDGAWRSASFAVPPKFMHTAVYILFVRPGRKPAIAKALLK